MRSEESLEEGRALALMLPKVLASQNISGHCITLPSQMYEAGDSPG